MRKRKILILSITIVAVALILETCILQYVNDKNAQTTSNVLLDRVIAVIDKNESSESEFVKSLRMIILFVLRLYLILRMRNRKWNIISMNFKRSHL